jgi:hypothetical protein
LQTKQAFTIVLGIVLLSLSATTVLADPLSTGGLVSVGDQYTITTIHGQAQAWIDGYWTIGPADIQLQVQVTFVGPHNVVFRILSGTFSVDYKNYVVDSVHWSGDYNLDTHAVVYQGPATAPNGGIGYFTLYAQDTGLGSGGVMMHATSDFSGEYGVLWHVDLAVVRFQAT